MLRIISGSHSAPFGIALLCAVAAAVQPVRAATIVVTTTDQHSVTECTLNDAFSAANADTAVNGCPAGAGADIIVLAAGATYHLVGRFEGWATVRITSAITIEGRGATLQGADRRFRPVQRLLCVEDGGTLILNQITLRSVDSPVLCRRATLSIGHSTVADNINAIVTEDCRFTLRHSTSAGTP